MSDKITRLFDFPYYQLEKYPYAKCFNYKVDNRWKSISTKEYLDQANKVSRALLDLGVKKNDKIAIITEGNTPKWHILDIGILQIGAQNVPLYATLSSKDYEYILKHSDAKYCFVSNSQLYEKVNSIIKNTDIIKLFSFEEINKAHSWNAFLNLGNDFKLQEKVNQIKQQISPEHLATIIYTSGTTGKPKGVMLSHKNIVSNIFMTSNSLKNLNNKDKIISYLPICHIFERASSYYNQYMGFEIYFVEDIEKLGESIKEIKPHFLAVVPRLVEKIFDKIIAKGNALTGLKKMLFFWALQLGERYEPYHKNGSLYRIKLGIARKLIFSKWKEALGGNLKFLLSGSAPLQDKLIRVFTAAGITIFEGYGMTEAAPAATLNDLTDNNFKIGTVGKALKGIELKIAKDKEILIKGDNIMLGYYKNKELTQKTIINNYLHTGDIGFIDNEGFLTITDRKKEIFKTSGGKYIAPSPIEGFLKQSPFIEQAMVIGEAQKMPAALIQLNIAHTLAWAKSKNISKENMINNPEIISKIQSEIDATNIHFGKWEQIKKFEITPDEWTIESGHLTPTLKMRRKIIKEKYKNLFEKIYKN